MGTKRKQLAFPVMDEKKLTVKERDVLLHLVDAEGSAKVAARFKVATGTLLRLIAGVEARRSTIEVVRIRLAEQDT